ncbi:hypothetical protein Ac2012v2_007497 [Leucoagaricus gongylophorus]
MPDIVQGVRDCPGANNINETTRMREIALYIAEATKDEKELFDIGLSVCVIVAHVFNRSHATPHASREIEMLLRNVKYIVEKYVQRKGILGKVFFWKGKTVQECCQECRSCLARCYHILLLQDNQVLRRQVREIHEHLEQTSPMESVTPNGLLGLLNGPLGAAIESERSIVNMVGRPSEARFRGRDDNNIRNVTSNVTDNSLNASGIGNTFNITYNICFRNWEHL